MAFFYPTTPNSPSPQRQTSSNDPLYNTRLLDNLVEDSRFTSIRGQTLNPYVTNEQPERRALNTRYIKLKHTKKTRIRIVERDRVGVDRAHSHIGRQLISDRTVTKIQGNKRVNCRIVTVKRTLRIPVSVVISLLNQPRSQSSQNSQPLTGQVAGDLNSRTSTSYNFFPSNPRQNS